MSTSPITKIGFRSCIVLQKWFMSRPFYYSKIGCIYNLTQRSIKSFASAKNDTLHLSWTHYDYNKALKKERLRRKWQNFKFLLGLNPRLSEKYRKSVVVLGTGWGGINFIRFLDIAKYNVTIISPRNFFAYTPLLPSVCSGTLSPRACLEPLRPHLLRRNKQVMQFYEAWGTNLNVDKKELQCEDKTGHQFSIPYDYLVLALGSEANTFNIPGVSDHAMFLKEVEHAREIRQRLINNFERALLPNTSEHVKQQLLHFVIVGGGPTGVETAAELADFLHKEGKDQYSNLIKYTKITLIEMLPKLLPMFSQDISEFSLSNLQSLNVDVLLQSKVTQLTKDKIYVETKGVSKILNYGFVLWASGVRPVPFGKHILNLLPHQKGNRILNVDENLRLKGGNSFIYGLGDCVTVSPEPLGQHAQALYTKAHKMKNLGAGTTWLIENAERLSSRFPQMYPTPSCLLKGKSENQLTEEQFYDILDKVDSEFHGFPPTAQVANQQARYLAAIFNNFKLHGDKQNAPAFAYSLRGIMAYVGSGQAVIEAGNKKMIGGKLTNFKWRAFYLAHQVSKTNRIVCLFDWFRTFLSGRDTGRDHIMNNIPSFPKS